MHTKKRPLTIGQGAFELGAYRVTVIVAAAEPAPKEAVTVVANVLETTLEETVKLTV